MPFKIILKEFKMTSPINRRIQFDSAYTESIDTKMIFSVHLFVFLTIEFRIKHNHQFTFRYKFGNANKNAAIQWNKPQNAEISIHTEKDVQKKNELKRPTQKPHTHWLKCLHELKIQLGFLPNVLAVQYVRLRSMR